MGMLNTGETTVDVTVAVLSVSIYQGKDGATRGYVSGVQFESDLWDRPRAEKNPGNLREFWPWREFAAPVDQACLAEAEAFWVGHVESFWRRGVLPVAAVRCRVVPSVKGTSRFVVLGFAPIEGLRLEFRGDLLAASRFELESPPAPAGASRGAPVAAAKGGKS